MTETGGCDTEAAAALADGCGWLGGICETAATFTAGGAAGAEGLATDPGFAVTEGTAGTGG